MPSAAYRSLLRTPGVAAFFLPASLGRAGIAMTGLSLVWLVHGGTGGFSAAGLVGGAFAATDALVAPQLVRLVDRFGQTRVLPPTLLGHAAAVTLLVALVAAGAPVVLLTVGGALVGATVPQLGAMSAARWAALLRADGRAAELPTAFSLESVGNAVAYLVGPMVVSALAASGRPSAGTLLAASLTVTGGFILAAQRGSAPSPSTGQFEHTRAKGALTRAPFLLLMGLNLAIGVYFGAVQVSVTAFTVEHGTPGAAAPVFAVSGVSGLFAGWLYGLRRWRAAPAYQLALATCMLAAGALLLLAVRSPLELGLVVVLTGASVPPLLVLFPVLAESTVHRTVLTRAFSWLGSASASGSAAAAAASGSLVDSLGSRGGFAVTAAAAGTMALQSLFGVRLLRTTGRPSARPAPTAPSPRD